MDRTFHFHVEPLRNGGGEISGTIGAALDITDRTHAEEELRESLQKLRHSDAERARLLSHLVKAQEQERKVIASGIHDDTIQVMGAVKLHLGMLRRSLDGKQSEALGRLEEEVHLAIDRLRHLLFDLRPPALDRDGLVPALQIGLDQMRTEDGIEYSLVNNLSSPPGDDAGTILYRIAAEAISNIRRHAGARVVNVSLETADGGVMARIQDDGAGFAVEEHRTPEPGHLGILGMRERAELAGGWCRIDSAPGMGTAVEFWIPASLSFTGEVGEPLASEGTLAS
jgi:signal transduction histidine kinase